MRTHASEEFPLKIQLNTDSHVQADPSLERHVHEAIDAALGRFATRLTRVEVHVRDTNAGKEGPQDKHCTIEARPEGRDPVTASDDADTVAAAVSGAARKLQRVLDTQFGRETAGR